MKSPRKFIKVVKWNEDSKSYNFNNPLHFWMSSFAILFIYILSGLLFGWAFGIWNWYKESKEFLTDSRKVYYEEIK